MRQTWLSYKLGVFILSFCVLKLNLMTKMKANSDIGWLQREPSFKQA